MLYLLTVKIMTMPHHISDKIQQPLSPAEQMLPNPHIVVASESVELHPSIELTHIAAINAENRAIKQGINPNALPLYGSAILRAETARKQTSDKLTGLLNREGLEMWFERNKPSKFVVLFSDARKFKEVNDTYGHNIGDKVIAYIGDTATSRIRVGETTAMQAELRKNPESKDAIAAIGRWGGDELLMFIDISDVDDGMEGEVISSIKSRFDDFGVYKDTEDPNISIPISIRSAAVLGRDTDNRSLTSYQTQLDTELMQLKLTEKET